MPYFRQFSSNLNKLPFRTMEWKYTCLSLYKHILKLHQLKLLPQQRLLGDSYVKQEFKLNKTDEEKFARPFVEEWLQYVEILENAEDAAIVGKEMPEEDVQSLSDEQKEQFYKLKEETEKVRDIMKKQFTEQNNVTYTDFNERK
ncbi:hypothetical protein ABK040_010076 [Willaertia magna]